MITSSVDTVFVANNCSYYQNAGFETVMPFELTRRDESIFKGLLLQWKNPDYVKPQ